MIICLETATNLCSVALCDSAGVISLKESNETKSHAALLTVFIEEILRDNGIKAADLDAVAVSKGPGSYTGLRIGVSVAKGIAYGASIPLIGIETTLSMFFGITGSRYFNPESDINTIFCPMLDARRMEVYYAIFDSGGNRLKDISAEIIDENSFSGISEDIKIIFFGDGSEKCRKVTCHKNSVFINNFTISASFMYRTALEKFNAGEFDDVAYFEPFYLKDFITTVQRKNILAF
jgi:tRNA threonylcarbamoyladenosine biosynthesis protein TsaB